MSFAVKKARLWRHVEEMAVSPPRLKPKKDDGKDWIKKIFARKEKICEFEDNTEKTVAKIRKMCTDTIQK